MKNQLVFDTTDAQSIADSDSVGAYLRSSDGTLLTHTDVGGKKALDVRVAEGINVEVDLNFADDSVTSYQGGTWTIDSITNPVTVQATNLDIRDLTAATDSVSSFTKDGAGNAITSHLVGSDQALDVYISGGMVTVDDAALAQSAILSSSNTLGVANTAQSVKASALTNRKYLWIHNNDNTKIYIGGSGVTASNGFPLSPQAVLEMRAGALVSPFFVGQSGKTPEIRVLELA